MLDSWLAPHAALSVAVAGKLGLASRLGGVGLLHCDVLEVREEIAVDPAP